MRELQPQEIEEVAVQRQMDSDLARQAKAKKAETMKKQREG